MLNEYTYQDLVAVGTNERERMAFVLSAINSHKNSDDYLVAYNADKYYRRRNATITEYQKLLYTVTGKAIPDNFSANFKMSSGHFHRFIIQENQFLLGNGVTWSDPEVAGKLGGRRKDFDSQLQLLGKKALVQKVAFGFFNVDHVDVFEFLEFVPLWDEEDGSLKAGVRFWQIDSSKPLRATLYELDGYTDIIWRQGAGSGGDYEILTPKRPYKYTVKTTPSGEYEILDGGNYPGFPIVPLWGNPEHQSSLVGLREQIDCYDLIKSGFANTVDEASYVYWTIQNAGGMDDLDLARFIERMKTVHAAAMDDAAKAESHQQEVPFQAREALLSRLEKDLYRDAMALDVEGIASGAATATQIRAAYEPLNAKCDEFEFCVLDFIYSLLEIAGVEGDVEPSFTRSMLVNVSESVNSVVSAAQYLSGDYVTRKVLDFLGDGGQAEAVLAEMEEAELDRFAAGVDAGGAVGADAGADGADGFV